MSHKRAKKAADRIANASLHRLRRQLLEAKAAKRAALDALAATEDALEAALAMSEPPPHTVFEPTSTKTSRAACAVLLASDWHVDEAVTPDQIGGYPNTFNPDIARARCARLFNGASALIAHHNAGMFDIRDMLVWFGGDMASGYLRDEDREANTMGPTEAALYFIELASAGLHRLLKIDGLERVRVICSIGNHQRMTRKVHHRTIAQNSLDWLAYHTLAKQFFTEPRITFEIPTGAIHYSTVYGTTLRFHHGNYIRYQGGILGMGVPAAKKIAAWDKTRRADLTLLGHFHDLAYYPTHVVNGSLVGYNAYAQSIGALPGPPAQAFFLIDAKRGPCMKGDIWVTRKA